MSPELAAALEAELGPTLADNLREFDACIARGDRFNASAFAGVIAGQLVDLGDEAEVDADTVDLVASYVRDPYLRDFLRDHAEELRDHADALDNDPDIAWDMREVS